MRHSKQIAAKPVRPDTELENAEIRLAQMVALLLGFAKGLAPDAQDRVKRMTARAIKGLAEHLEAELYDLAPIQLSILPKRKASTKRRAETPAPAPVAAPALTAMAAATMSVPEIVRAFLRAQPAGLTTAELLVSARRVRDDIVPQTLYGALTTMVKGREVGRTGRFKNYRYSLLGAPAAPEPEDNDEE